MHPVAYKPDKLPVCKPAGRLHVIWGIISIKTMHPALSHKSRNRPLDTANRQDTLRQNPRHKNGRQYRQEKITAFGALTEPPVAPDRQERSHVHVIIGGPPYSAKQNNFDDENPNLRYPLLDCRIRDTYVRRGKTRQKASLYDSYSRVEKSLQDLKFVRNLYSWDHGFANSTW